MFGFGKKVAHREITPSELELLIAEDRALVVDVREPGEFAQGHIPGAVNMPLSGFQPSRLPDPAGKTIVLNCQGGKRSGMALEQCGAARAEVDTHLAGGFGAWAQSGFPVER
jgi:rhodanese-related sulfurtransferase